MSNEMRLLLPFLILFLAIIALWTLWQFVTNKPPDERVDVLQLEISELSYAMQDYKNAYGEFPPSMALDDPERLEKLTQHLKKAFPRHEYKKGLPLKFAFEELDPAEAVVFFLGGVPSADLPRRCLGFSTDPTDPLGCSSAGQVKFRKPFYEFDNNRLIDRDNDGFLEYTPPYLHAPFVYFDSSNYGSIYIDRSRNNADIAVAYQKAEGSWYAPDSFQLIAAGPDDKFGETKSRVIGTGTGMTEDDQDNYTSFTHGRLVKQH